MRNGRILTPLLLILLFILLLSILLLLLLFITLATTIRRLGTCTFHLAIPHPRILDTSHLIQTAFGTIAQQDLPTAHEFLFAETYGRMAATATSFVVGVGVYFSFFIVFRVGFGAGGC